MVNALIIVDPQNDFCEGGALAVSNSNEIFEKINLLREGYIFEHTFITLDWHGEDHISFSKNHDQEPFTLKYINGKEEMLWPVHCVRNTEGAKISKLLKLLNNEIYVKKGIQNDQQQYSGFGTESNPTDLEAKLKNLNVDKVYIVGLALDFCVGNTALDAKKAGFDVTVIQQCTKSVSEKTEEVMLNEFKQKGIKYVSISEIGV